jgi:hypothetical protein
MRQRSDVAARLMMLPILSVAVLVLLVLGCSYAPNPLVGAWEMVEPDVGALDPDSSLDWTSDAYLPVKILTDSYFAFGYLTPVELVYGGGGVYTYDGRGHYSEYIRYHSLPFLVGTRVDFTCRLEGDLWYHDGAYTVQGETREIHEVWRRLDEGKPFTPDTTRVKWRKQPSDLKTT